MSERCQQVKTLNEYNYPVRPTAIDRPNNLHTEHQLQVAVESVLPDGVDVTTSTRMTHTVAEATFDGRTDELQSVTVSFRIFDDEENRYSAGNGWEVVVSCLDDIGVLDV